MNRVVSECINAVRFPLAFLIVLQHYYAVNVTREYGGGIYAWLGSFSSDYLPVFVVPLFFMISGYLFFKNVDISCIGFNKYTLDKYKEKINNRIKTLVIPYLAWNIIVFLGLLLVQVLTGDRLQPLNKPIENIGFLDMIKSLWAITENGYPIDSPLWFIRDLFIVCLFSPVIMFWVKYLKHYGLIIVSLLYLICGVIIPYGPSSTCQYYFILGVYMSVIKVHQKDLLETLLNKRIVSSIVLFLCFLTIFSFTEIGTNAFEVCKRFYRFVSVLCIWPLLRYLVVHKNFRPKSLLTKSSFWVFAIHKPIIVILSTAIFSLEIIKTSNDFILSLFILLIPTLVYIVSVLLYYLMVKYAPYLKFLNGFRI